MSAAYAKRFEAVFLCTHTKGPHMTFTKASKYMHKSRGFVKKWVKRFKETGTVDDFPQRGKSKATTLAQDRAIIRIFKRNSNLTLRQGQYKLSKMNINISIMTIKRRLEEYKIAWRSTFLKPLLTEKQIERRCAWAAINLSRDWSNVVFTDEAIFHVWTPKKKAWTTKDTRLVQRTVKHPAKLNVWGCFSALGFGTLYLFTNNLTAQVMVKIYQKCLLPSAEAWFGRPRQPWVLQEDNDPKHRSRLCTLWRSENDIERLDWPSQSPDANPIENVWAFIKHKLAGKRIMTLKQLSRQIRKIWRSLPISYAENLVGSMPQRCDAILKNKGDWTLY